MLGITGLGAGAGLGFLGRNALHRQRNCADGENSQSQAKPSSFGHNNLRNREITTAPSTLSRCSQRYSSFDEYQLNQRFLQLRSIELALSKGVIFENTANIALPGEFIPVQHLISRCSARSRDFFGEL